MLAGRSGTGAILSSIGGVRFLVVARRSSRARGAAVGRLIATGRRAAHDPLPRPGGPHRRGRRGARRLRRDRRLPRRAVLAATPWRRASNACVLPLRDAFAAVFFFAFGLTLDPGDVGGVAWPVASPSPAFVLNTIAGVVAAPARPRVGPPPPISLTVLARGEFSLISPAWRGRRPRRAHRPVRRALRARARAGITPASRLGRRGWAGAHRRRATGRSSSVEGRQGRRARLPARRG